MQLPKAGVDAYYSPSEICSLFITQTCDEKKELLYFSDIIDIVDKFDYHQKRCVQKKLCLMSHQQRQLTLWELILEPLPDGQKQGKSKPSNQKYKHKKYQIPKLMQKLLLNINQ